MNAAADDFAVTRSFPRSKTKIYRVASVVRPFGGIEGGLTATSLGAQPKSSAFAWLDHVYSLTAKNESDAAIDVLFPKMDKLFREGHFDTADDVLRAVDVARLNTSLMVAVLAITRPAKASLPQRQVLLQRIERRLRELEPDRVERLLRRVR